MSADCLPAQSSLVYDCGGIQVHHSDALDLLRSMPDESISAVICDPQYGLSQVSPAATIAAVTAWVSGDREQVPDGRGFMGNDWDSFVPPPAIWDECLRVLTPGGHLLAFAGSRMADLAGLSIRLAGFEIRDSIDVIGSRISWLYGTGMPKSKTVLKPAHEPILVARKPLTGTEVATVQRYGTGALNVAACKVAHADAVDLAASLAKNPGRGIETVTSEVYGPDRPQQSVNREGRWPSNVVLLHAPLYDPETGEVIGDACVDGCVPGCAVAELDAQSGITTSQGGSRGQGGGRGAYNVFGAQPDFKPGVGDRGTASRFFPQFRWEPKAPRSERPKVNGLAHPCVKPLSLIRWLTRLVTPKGGTVLDWCAGSGTTGQAARAEGFDCILIEREAKYIPHILQRLDGPDVIEPPVVALSADSEPTDLLGLLEQVTS